MAMLKPQSRSDMALVNGVGARKLDAYGDAFLDVVRQFRIVV
jgi:ATP-dependent DNA helicase RecQ